MTNGDKQPTSQPPLPRDPGKPGAKDSSPPQPSREPGKRNRRTSRTSTKDLNRERCQPRESEARHRTRLRGSLHARQWVDE